MKGLSELRGSPEYESFRASVALRKVLVNDYDEKPWLCYDAGPKSVPCPLVFLPPVSGKADVFFRQILPLSTKGYRVLSIDFPAYWNIPEFCKDFHKLLDILRLPRVHIFGASIGGYLAQKFAECSALSLQRVGSLILCNTFTDTTIFDRNESSFFYWALPSMILKRLVMGGFPDYALEKEIANSVDFMVESLDSLSQSELASRLTLNCARSACDPIRIRYLPITVVDVFDDCALTHGAREDIHTVYPDAKRAHLKSGGNFPFLSRASEVNLHIEIHLKQFMESELLRAKDLQ